MTGASSLLYALLVGSTPAMSSQRPGYRSSLVGREWPGLAPSALSYLISNNIESTR